MEETGEDVQGWSLRDSKKTGRKSPWFVAVSESLFINYIYGRGNTWNCD